MNYAIEHQGKVFTPDGKVVNTSELACSVEAFNKQKEHQEIEWLRTGPDKVFLYVTLPKDLTHRPTCGSDSAHAQPQFATASGDVKAGLKIGTFLGTPVATNIVIGPKVIAGFQGHFRGGTYRRAVSCKIFGVQYHGWYMESSGDYCILKRAKVQGK